MVVVAAPDLLLVARVVGGRAGDRRPAGAAGSPSSGSLGCHTRSRAMIAPADSSEATMSVSSTET